jgi:hypothetical protein
MNRRGGDAVLAAIRSFMKANADEAMLGVRLELVFDVRDGTGGMALVELEWTVTLLAAKLGVAIEDGIGNGLYFPERLIPTGGANTATFHFAFKQLLGNGHNFGCHGLLSTCS